MEHHIISMILLGVYMHKLSYIILKSRIMEHYFIIRFI